MVLWLGSAACHVGVIQVGRGFTHKLPTGGNFSPILLVSLNNYTLLAVDMPA